VLPRRFFVEEGGQRRDGIQPRDGGDIAGRLDAENPNASCGEEL